jgi:hypothetical protein
MNEESKSDNYNDNINNNMNSDIIWCITNNEAP